MTLARLVLLILPLLFVQCANDKTSSDKKNGTSAISGLCAPTLIGSYKTDKKAPVFGGMEYFKFPITTNSKEAQKYFNQGWALGAGFNHIEAARSFYWAAKEDPDCAMCYWGLAYVLGPNYNAGMDPEVVADAIEATQQAKLLSAKSTERERDLIEAMSARYPTEYNDDRTEHDQAYSDVLGELYEKYPGDHDIAALYAESLMGLHPWDLWTKDGKQQPWTAKILAILTSVIEEDPKHVIANHMYIHAVEASKTAELGNDAAELLFDIAPGLGHLVHMPSHIYIRTGDYRACTDVNIAAVNVDSTYVSACHAAGAYPLAYYPHNFHFLCACAALEGNGTLALEAAFRMQEKLDTEAMRIPGMETIQHYYSIPYYIMVKFQLWDEILAVPTPDEDLIYPSAIVHYARGMALANKKDFNGANNELELLRNLAQEPILENFTIWEINGAMDLLDIAQNVLEGEIMVQQDSPSKAVPFFEKAIVTEDDLNYNEPPDWFFSVRHYLGNAYLEMGNWSKAEETFKQDLATFPSNGWALNGLVVALEKQGKQSEADKFKTELAKAWERADVKLDGSQVL